MKLSCAFFSLVIFVSVCYPIYSQSKSPRTNGDVKECLAQDPQCTKCSTLFPDFQKFDKIKKCFDDHELDSRTCLKNHGIIRDDSSPCYQRKIRKEKEDFGNVEEAIKCYKRCVHRKHKLCRVGCTAQRTEKNETRRKLWKECREDDELLDCLESDQDSGLVTRPRG